MGGEAIEKTIIKHPSLPASVPGAAVPVPKDQQPGTTEKPDAPTSEPSGPAPKPKFQPPDGGFWAWVVMTCCFLCNGIIFGIINTFGILFVRLRADMEANGVEDAAFKCSLVGSLTIGSTFFFSFLVGVVSDRFGLRVTAVLGGILATLGMGISALFHNNIQVLYLSYGIMFGIGSSTAYTPSLTILGHYFKRHLGVVNGIVTAGSSVFTIVLSFLNQYVLAKHGVLACFQMFTGLASVLILCGLAYVPLHPARTPNMDEDPNAKKISKGRRFLEKVIYMENWRNKRYIIWALTVPVALFGYFVPYVHLVQFAKDIPLDPDDVTNGEKASVLVACIGITSGVGRLIFGKISDIRAIQRNGNRVILQQVAFMAIGLSTMLLSIAAAVPSQAYEVLLLFCCIMGLFDGCFVTMMGPIAFDICGPAGANQAIGFLLALCSIPLTAGPPIAGIIYDHVGDYIGAFIGAGIPPIVGSILLLTIRFFPVTNQDDDYSEDLEKRPEKEDLLASEKK